MVHLRRIRRNKGKGMPSAIVCLDTETTSAPEDNQWARHTLRVGVARYFRFESGFITRRRELVFTQTDTFWNWLTDRVSWQRPTWVFGHNIGFDLLVLGLAQAIETQEITFKFQYLRKEKVVTAYGFICDEDPPIIISCFLAGKGRVIFTDTMNWFRTSLAKIGDAVDRPKWEYPGEDTPTNLLIDYCRNDVMIVEDSVVGLIRWTAENKLGVFRSTAPAQSRSAWRHRFYTHPVTIHDDKQVRILERDCYFSGRVQVFHAGKLRRKIHELDACGAYVSVLHDSEFPVKLLRSSCALNPGKCPVFDRPLACAATVSLDTSDQYPKRLENRDIVWATGEFVTALAGPELLRAVSAGDVKTIHSWSLYRLEPAFQKFAAWTWEERMKHERSGNTLYAELAKLLGNSFYGKWGQRLAKWKDIDYRANLRPFERRWVFTDDHPQGVVLRSIGSITQIQVRSDEHPQAFPAIAAWTTAYLRERLRVWIEDAGPDEVPYVCCDSIYTTDLGMKKLWSAGWIGERKLGLLEHRETATSAQFLGVNNYRFGDTIKASGVKRDSPPAADGRYQTTTFDSFQIGADRTTVPGVFGRTHLVHLPAPHIVGRKQKGGQVLPLRFFNDEISER